MSTRMERFGKHVLAGLLLVVAALIVLKLLIGVVAGLFFPVLAIILLIAIIWAFRVLF